MLRPNRGRIVTVWSNPITVSLARNYELLSASLTERLYILLPAEVVVVVVVVVAVEVVVVVV